MGKRENAIYVKSIGELVTKNQIERIMIRYDF
jgi:hypothetical protein